MRALCLIRNQPAYRLEAFVCGLERFGAKVETTRHFSGHVGPDDVAVIWNRYGSGEALATRVEKAGGRTLVCENGYMGRDWRGSHWYAISLHQHNGAGEWYPCGPERWDRWGVPLDPWRQGDEPGDGKLLVLPQRGIGPNGVAMPRDFVDELRRKIYLRNFVVRDHPGETTPKTSLDEDLADARMAITWGSGAALKALASGVPVACFFDRWIGRPAARFGNLEPKRDDAARLAMFQRLAWAMWSVEEIASGKPFHHLLSRDGGAQP